MIVTQVHWSDVGGLENVKSKLRELIEWPTLFADKLARFHVSPPKGVLLYGPPGPFIVTNSFQAVRRRCWRRRWPPRPT